ncbi:hypothetical protein MSG28_012860, partial [Choristoneura fumiferana]
MVAPQFFTTWAYTTGANLVSTSGVFAGKAGRSGSDADVVLAELKKDGEVSMAHPTTAIKTSYSDDLSQYTIKPLDLVASSRGVQETVGNVVFGDYERDERECHTTVQDLADQKAECEPAILLMPLADVLLHPEYKHFGAKTSVALMKLITAVKSSFMMPRASDTPSDRVGHAWVGHWWMGGLRCYDRGRSALDLFRFYHEVFSVKPLTKTYLTYYLEIGNPKVWNLDTTEVK